MDEDKLLLKGFISGVFLCAAMIFFVGVVEAFIYNSSDVTKGKAFELNDKIYKCKELTLD